ncbi:MAG: hypothetical protein E7609_06330 [Ruminococcaceae bacterium]|nr:hypothetical protein [Oscillospiraceae bacterium]
MKDLTQGNVYKTFFLFALPLVFAGFLMQAYNLIDTVIAGRFLGEAGLAALGATSELLILTSSTFWGVNAGLGIYTASLFGAKKIRRPQKQFVYYLSHSLRHDAHHRRPARSVP